MISSLSWLGCGGTYVKYACISFLCPYMFIQAPCIGCQPKLLRLESLHRQLHLSAGLSLGDTGVHARRSSSTLPRIQDSHVQLQRSVLHVLHYDYSRRPPHHPHLPLDGDYRQLRTSHDCCHDLRVRGIFRCLCGYSVTREPNSHEWECDIRCIHGRVVEP